MRTMKQRLSHVLDSGRIRVTRRSVLAQIACVFTLAALSLALIRPTLGEDVKKIGGNVTAPRPISKTEPKYTPEAKAAHIEGKVVLKIVVGEDGTVHDIRVVQSLDEGLDRNAVAAVSTWLFEPAKEDGKPVTVEASVDINFKLL